LHGQPGRIEDVQAAEVVLVAAVEIGQPDPDGVCCAIFGKAASCNGAATHDWRWSKIPQMRVYKNTLYFFFLFIFAA
jgi:hypothetical protein